MTAFLLVNAFGLFLFALGWWVSARVHRRSPRAALVGAGVILGLLAMKSLLYRFPAIEGTLFPFVWYVLIYDHLITALGLCFFGWAMALLPIRWNRLAVAVVVVGLFARGVWMTTWMAWPEHHGQDRGANALHHYRQSTMYTCAPSACVAVLAHLGIASTESEMAELCLTTRWGTSEFNTFRGLSLKLEGTAWRARIRWRTAEELTDPSCYAVISWQGAFHAIATVGQGGDVLVHDPMAPRPAVWDLAKLKERYGGTAVVVEPRE